MPLVYAGVCSHAPGITGRAERADPEVRDAFYAAYDAMRLRLEATEPDALVVIAAEHFANFFMNNMPAYAMGMADYYEGPIEEPRVAAHRQIPRPRRARPLPAPHRTGDADLRRGLRRGVAPRPRHRGSAALPDPPVRPSHHPGQHQLPGTAPHPAGQSLEFRRGAAPGRRQRRRAHRGGRHRRHLALAGHPPTRAASTRTGTATSSTAGARATATGCAPTATPTPTSMLARAASRSGPTSPQPRPVPDQEPSTSTLPSRYSRSAAPSPTSPSTRQPIPQPNGEPPCDS